MSLGVLRIGALAAICCGLAACGVSQLTSPFKNGLFGGGKTDAPATTAATPEPGVNQANLMTAAQTGQASSGDATAANIGCPSLDVWAGDRSISFHAAGAAGDSLSVMHRGDITNTARECAPAASGLMVKYGFSGRVLLGPKGKAGTVTLPAKITVLDGAKATLKTEKIRVVVDVPAGSTEGYFSEVREIMLPIAPGTSPKTYRMYVGFDQSAAGR